MNVFKPFFFIITLIYKKMKRKTEEEDSSIEVFKLRDLIRDHIVDERTVTVDTHYPTETKPIHIYDYHSDGYDHVVFSLDEYQMLHQEAIKLKFRDRSEIILYLGEGTLTEADKQRLREASLLKINASYKSTLGLGDAKAEVDRLNKILKCDNFRLNIDYLYSIHPNDTIYSYDFENMNDLMLCLYEGDVCVSSIVLHTKEGNHDLKISSRTSETHVRNNLNKLLRAAAIVVAQKIKPDLTVLISNAISSISLHLLVKYFDGYMEVIDEDRDEVSEQTLIDLTPSDHRDFTHDDAQKIIEQFQILDVTIPLDMEHVALAEQVFTDTAPKVRCIRSSTTAAAGGVGTRRRMRKPKHRSKNKNNNNGTSKTRQPKRRPPRK